jgi:hypothetical protein
MHIYVYIYIYIYIYVCQLCLFYALVSWGLPRSGVALALLAGGSIVSELLSLFVVRPAKFAWEMDGLPIGGLVASVWHGDKM